jgi:hypothetical protein
MIRRSIGTAPGGLWLFICVLCGPLVDLFTPRGLLSHGDNPQERILQLAYLASLGGILLAMSSLDQARWILERCSQGRRLAFKWTALLTSASLGSAVVLGTHTIMGNHVHWEELGIPLLNTLFHQTILGGIVLSGPHLGRSVLVIFPFLSWILPALITTQNIVLLGLLRWLQCTPRGLSADDSTTIELLGGFGPIVVLATSHGLFVLMQQLNEVRNSRRHPRQPHGA